jgi:hypothetical protein
LSAPTEVPTTAPGTTPASRRPWACPRERPQVSASAQGKYRPRYPDILGPVEPGRQVVVGRPPTGPTPAADRRVPVVAGARTARKVMQHRGAGHCCRLAGSAPRRQVLAGSPGLTSRLAEVGAACGPHPSLRTGGLRQRVTTTHHDNHPGQTAGRNVLVRDVRAAKVAPRRVGQSCRSWLNNREAHRCRVPSPCRTTGQAGATGTGCREYGWPIISDFLPVARLAV